MGCAYRNILHYTVSNGISFENNGYQVNGYGFCSNGRYAQEGIIKNRFMPRLYKVSPDSLLEDNGVIDPLKCWSAVCGNFLFPGINTCETQIEALLPPFDDTRGGARPKRDGLDIVSSLVS